MIAGSTHHFAASAGRPSVSNIAQAPITYLLQNQPLAEIGRERQKVLTRGSRSGANVPTPINSASTKPPSSAIPGKLSSDFLNSRASAQSKLKIAALARTVTLKGNVSTACFQASAASGDESRAGDQTENPRSRAAGNGWMASEYRARKAMARAAI